MIDAFGRNVTYLRLSVTDLCNYRCKYCMPEQGIEKKEQHDILTFEDIVCLVTAAAELGISKVRLTGGEPLVRKDIVSLVSMLRKIDGVNELAMTTNGALLDKFAKGLKKAGLNRLNISLDTLDEHRFAEITRGGDLSDVLNGIEAAAACGLLPIRINCVAMKGFNDDELVALTEFTDKANIDVRFIELMPIGCDKSLNYQFISSREIMSKLGRLEPCFEAGSVAKYYRRKGAKGRIGFISSMSNHFCNSCNKIRLTADGKLKPCLHSDDEVDVSAAIKSGDISEIKQKISDVILGKPEKHLLTSGKSPIKREMNAIGG